jgi:hypothetical protein
VFHIVLFVCPVEEKKEFLAMSRNQIHQQFVVQRSHEFIVPGARTAVILVVGVAGLIHLSLIHQYLEEQVVYGLIFTALAIFQLNLALLLALRPGAAIYQLGIWGSGLIVLVYVTTRLIPLPVTSVPEEAGVLEVAATVLELAAVLLLAFALPEPIATRRPRGTPFQWGLGGAIIFAFLWLIVSGEAQWMNATSILSLTWAGTQSWSAFTPVLVGMPLPHLWLTVPWWSVPAVPLLSVLVGLNLAMSTRLLSTGDLSRKGRRFRLLALFPAGLAAPVCCTAGTPLLTMFGVPLMLGVWPAPFAVLLSATLLALNLVFLRLRRGRSSCISIEPVAAVQENQTEEKSVYGSSTTMRIRNHGGMRMH